MLDLTPFSPSTVLKGDFLGETACASSPPAIRAIPRPPAAASAAGGRGIHGSRRVHSLGVRGGVPAGGVGEVAVVPEWLLLAAVSSSVGAAPLELRRGSAVSSSFAARWSSREDIPFAGVREMAVPAIDDLEDAVAGGLVGLAVRRGGWRCSCTEGRRLPCRQGEPPSPRLWRSCGGLRRRSVQLEDDDADVRAQEGLFVFSFVSWVFL